MSSSSKKRATPVIGAPVMASCTEPTSESPLNSTTIPAAMTCDGVIDRLCHPVFSPSSYTSAAGTTAMNPPATCWKKIGVPILLSRRLKETVTTVVSQARTATTTSPPRSTEMPDAIRPQAKVETQ